MLEALEPRLLMSADPTVSLNATADIVTILQEATPGGDGKGIIDLTVNGTTTTYQDGANGLNSLTIQGLGGNDSFTFGGEVTVAVSIDGGDGTDTITGPDQDTDWLIDSANGGTFGGIHTFSNLESLVGGAADDNFAFGPAGSLTGGVDGGGGNNAAVVNDPSTGPYNNNTWTIDSADSGSLNGTAFTAIANLIGGKGADTFEFQPGGSVSGLVDGGTDDAQVNPAVTDKLDFSGLSDDLAVDLNAATAIDTTTSDDIVSGFQRIDTVAGGSSTADTLLGFDAPLVNWTIDGSNSGKVSATDVATIAFSGFENLTGVSNTASDAYTFGESGSLSGTVDGGAGTADSISVFESAGKYTTFNASDGRRVKPSRQPCR